MAFVFGVYLTLVVAFGYFSGRYTKNLSDYILGGRHLKGPVVALSAGASDMGSWLLMALPGAVLIHGLNYLWLPIGLIIGAYCNWRFVAARLRVYTEIAGDALTLPAYFSGRFPEHAKWVRASTAIVVLVFFIFYTSSGFVAGADLAHLLFPVGFHTGLLITAGVIIAYTALGGFLAISWLDFFQGSLMFFALLIVPAVAFHHVSLTPFTWAAVTHNAGYFNPLSDFSVLSVLSLLAWGLGYFGQPHILVRFMSAKSHKEIPIARRICMFWMTMALLGAVLVGVVGNVFFSKSPLDNPEDVFIAMTHALFNPWLAGILISAVLAAIMNTASAQLLSSASALIEDFYHPFLSPKASNKTLVLGAKIAVLLVASIAFLLAWNPKGSILELVSYAWAGLGGAFGPVILLSLYWKRMTGNAAVIGMSGGALTVIVWELLGYHFGGFFDLYSIIPAFIVNILLIYSVSLMTKTTGKNTQHTFEQLHKILRS
jgi:sodium/proline symporter